ncbi:repressor PtrB [Chitinimonas prasina]|uniref:Repressor PtrB n=1 Tax=Chitinimonas prasina TaxID=1434937 RepID=A0ABQ5YFN4_9NEIS|nr:TraR/DksA family transcriptional regulator [Chitinimonas prasina]GLR13297.1 repressor PtrB [Chitinimonas prasina]
MNHERLDQIDQANEIAQARLDSLLAAQRATVRQVGTAECQDCGEDIPTARRAAYPAATRCIACQCRQETRRKQGVVA